MLELLGQRREALHDRPVGRLGVAVVLLVLGDAEVGPVEELLEADHLRALGRGVPRELLVLVEHRLLVAGPGGLGDRGAYDRHAGLLRGRWRRCRVGLLSSRLNISLMFLLSPSRNISALSTGPSSRRSAWISPRITDRTPQGIAGASVAPIRAGELAPGDRLPTVRERGRRPRRSARRRSRRVAGAASYGPGRVARPRRHLRPRHAAPVAAAAPARPRRRGSATACGSTSRAARPTRRCCPASGPRFDRVSQRAPAPAPTRTSPVLPELREVLRRPGPTPAEVDHRRRRRHSTPSAARSSRSSRFGDRVVVEYPGFPPFFDLLEHSAPRSCPSSSTTRHRGPTSLRRALDARGGRRRPAAARAQPDRRLHDGRPRQRARRGAARRPPSAPWIVEDDHSGAIASAPTSRLGHLAARPRRARAQVLQVARPRPADRRARRPAAVVDALVARRMLGPGWTSRMLQTILARPAHRAAVARRGRRGAASVLRPPARPGRARSPSRGIAIARPTASTCGSRSATSAPRWSTWPPRHPRRRRHPFFPGEASPPQSGSRPGSSRRSTRPRWPPRWWAPQPPHRPHRMSCIRCPRNRVRTRGKQMRGTQRLRDPPTRTARVVASLAGLLHVAPAPPASAAEPFGDVNVRRTARRPAGSMSGAGRSTRDDV